MNPRIPRSDLHRLRHLTGLEGSHGHDEVAMEDSCGLARDVSAIPDTRQSSERGVRETRQTLTLGHYAFDQYDVSTTLP